MDKTIWNGTEYRHFDHLHAAAANGEILNLKKMQLAQPTLRKDGYVQVGHQKLWHRVVATCWLTRPEGASHVHHINGDKADNRASNLEWVTPKRHRSEHGPTRLGIPQSEATKEKLRNARLGKTMPERTRTKIRDSLNRLASSPDSPWKNNGGHPRSEETRRRMSDTNHRNTRCEVDGVVYPSFTAAAKARGERPLTLRKRCLSNSFPNYRALSS